MSRSDLGPQVEAGTTRLVNGHVAILFRRGSSTEGDLAVIMLWADKATVGDFLTEYRRTPWGSRWLREDTKAIGLSICSEVCYAGQGVFSCELREGAGMARLCRLHSGGRLNPGSFSLRYQASSHAHDTSPTVSGAVMLTLRPETEAERLAGSLWPEPTVEPEPYPCITELLALRQALSRSR